METLLEMQGADPAAAEAAAAAVNGPVSGVRSGSSESRAVMDRIGDIFNNLAAEAPTATPAPVTPAPATPAAPAAPAATPSQPSPGATPINIPDDVLKRQLNIGASPSGASAPTPQPAAGATEDDMAGAPAGVEADAKARHAWVTLRREARQFKTELDQARKDLDAAKAAKPPEVEEVAKLKQQLSDYEDRIGKLDVTQSKTFQAQFDQPLNSLFTRSLSIMTKSGKDPRQARDLLLRVINPNASFEEIQSALSEEPVAVQGALFNNAVEMVELQKRRHAALSDWRSTAAALRENESRTSVAQLSQAIVADTTQAVEALRDEGSWLFMKSDVDQQWNTDVDQRIKAVHGILKMNNPADLVKYVADGVAARTYRQLHAAASTRVKELEAELARRNGVVPRMAGGGTVPTPQPASQKKAATDPKRFLDDLLPSGGQAPVSV